MVGMRIAVKRGIRTALRLGDHCALKDARVRDRRLSRWANAKLRWTELNLGKCEWTTSGNK